MKIRNLIIVIVALFMMLFIRGNVFSQEALFNNITDQHLYINETKISLIPPLGGKLSNRFIGITFDKQFSSIIINTVPIAYANFKPKVIEDAKKSGLVLLSSTPYKINNFPSELVLYKGKYQLYDVFVYQLITGDTKETITLSGMFLEEKPELKEQIKNSLLSIVFEPHKKVNHNNVLSYKVDPTGTRFKLAKTLPNSLTYTTDGKFTSDNKLRKVLLVSQNYHNQEIVDQKKYIQDSFKFLSFKIDQTLFYNAISVDGLSGYEVYLKGKSKDNGSLRYQYDVYLFAPLNSVYKISCITTDNNSLTLAEVKKIARTFERF